MFFWCSFMRLLQCLAAGAVCLRSGSHHGKKGVYVGTTQTTPDYTLHTVVSLRRHTNPTATSFNLLIFPSARLFLSHHFPREESLFLYALAYKVGCFALTSSGFCALCYAVARRYSRNHTKPQSIVQKLF